LGNFWKWSWDKVIRYNKNIWVWRSRIPKVKTPQIFTPADKLYCANFNLDAIAREYSSEVFTLKSPEVNEEFEQILFDKTDFEYIFVQSFTGTRYLLNSKFWLYFLNNIFLKNYFIILVKFYELLIFFKNLHKFFLSVILITYKILDLHLFCLFNNINIYNLNENKENIIKRNYLGHIEKLNFFIILKIIKDCFFFYLKK